MSCIDTESVGEVSLMAYRRVAPVSGLQLASKDWEPWAEAGEVNYVVHGDGFVSVLSRLRHCL